MKPTPQSIPDTLLARRTCRDFSDHPITEEDLSAILWAAQGATGSDGKRTAPSAHALYPIRLLVAIGNVQGFTPGLYYGYDAETGLLSLAKSGDVLPALETAALEEQPWISKAAAVIIITADFTTACQAFAEQPPLGLRGERYVWIEAGGIAQNMHLLATEMGLGGVLVAGIDDTSTAEALNLEPPWQPVLLFCLGHPDTD